MQKHSIDGSLWRGVYLGLVPKLFTYRDPSYLNEFSHRSLLICLSLCICDFEFSSRIPSINLSRLIWEPLNWVNVLVQPCILLFIVLTALCTTSTKWIMETSCICSAAHQIYCMRKLIISMGMNFTYQFGLH